MNAIITIPQDQLRKAPPIQSQLESFCEGVELIDGVYFFHSKPGKLLPATSLLDEHNLDYKIRSHEEIFLEMQLWNLSRVITATFTLLLFLLAPCTNLSPFALIWVALPWPGFV